MGISHVYTMCKNSGEGLAKLLEQDKSLLFLEQLWASQLWASQSWELAR